MDDIRLRRDAIAAKAEDLLRLLITKQDAHEVTQHLRGQLQGLNVMLKTAGLELRISVSIAEPPKAAPLKREQSLY